RRGPLLRPRRPYYRRRADGLRTCLERLRANMRGKFMQTAATGATAVSTDGFLVIAFLLGYLLGSIPFGLILTRLAGTQDLRTVGSGNIGATNVLRTGHKGLAAATLLGDMLKGTLAVTLASSIGGPNAAMIAALAAFLGHLFPVWLNFKGGKGVAVYIGVLIGLFWPAAVVFCVVWLATAATTRYSSLSGLVASFITPIFLWWFDQPALASLLVVL